VGRFFARPGEKTTHNKEKVPFNVLFDDDTTFWLLDRSRGGWGDLADDISCMTINYLFFSLQRRHSIRPLSIPT